MSGKTKIFHPTSSLFSFCPTSPQFIQRPKRPLLFFHLARHDQPSLITFLFLLPPLLWLLHLSHRILRHARFPTTRSRRQPVPPSSTYWMRWSCFWAAVRGQLWHFSILMEIWKQHIATPRCHKSNMCRILYSSQTCTKFCLKVFKLIEWVCLQTLFYLCGPFRGQIWKDRIRKLL